MKTLRRHAALLLDRSVATRGRPLSFQIAVATFFTIDLIGFVAFCVIKFVAK
ncbi:MAG TPA: hypothetical protein VGC95_03320 [Chitinophagaceae bacterium]